MPGGARGSGCQNPPTNAGGGGQRPPGGKAVAAPGDEGPLRGQAAADAAKKLGYPRKEPWRSHGQPVFGNGSSYITPDVDSHSGGLWKLLNRAGRRIATLDGDGNVIGE